MLQNLIFSKDFMISSNCWLSMKTEQVMLEVVLLCWLSVEFNDLVSFCRQRQHVTDWLGFYTRHPKLLVSIIRLRDRLFSWAEPLVSLCSTPFNCRNGDWSFWPGRNVVIWNHLNIMETRQLAVRVLVLETVMFRGVVTDDDYLFLETKSCH